METGKRPLTLLMKSLNNNVIVRLKSDVEYRGRLTQCDSYMNLILDDAAEYSSGEPTAKYGNLFIRGNNIIFICVDATHF
ncbi:MAG: U6 snRNA-associated Sm-like protein LSm6 [Candidatus Bathyarchaeota archaeon]